MVVGGSIGSTADPCEVSGSGGFENATINGHLSGAPILRGNMVLNGSADVGTIYFYGAGGSTMASLSASAGKTALITLSGSSADLRIEEGAWLTLASNVTVEGSGDIGGSIGADVNRLINYGTIRATGAMNVLTHYFDNRGTLSIEEGGTVELGLSDQQGMREQTYTSANGGAIHVNGGTLNLYDDFTTADLNQDQFVRNGGQVNINGTLNNEGMTLDRIGPFRLNGKIFGGVIGSALRPAEVDFHAALESVTVYGELDGSGSIRDRLTLNGVAGGGDLSFSAAGDCATITLNSSEGYTGTVNMNGSDLWVDSTDTLVVGEGITIQGWGGLGAHYGGDTLAGIVNYGVIRANGNATGDYETLEMLTNDLDNRGLIVVEDGAVLQFGLREQAGYYEQKWTNANGGAIHVKGGVLDLYGDFDTADLNQATFDRTGGEVRIHGTLNNDGMTLDNIGAFRLNGTIVGGVVGSTARQADVDFHGAMENVTVNGLIDGSGSFREHLTLNGVAQGSFSFGSDDSGGVVTVNADALKTALINLDGGTLTVSSDDTLDLGTRAAVQGHGTVGNIYGDPSSTIINRGRITADNAAEALLMRSGVLDNRGTMTAQDGATLQFSSLTESVLNSGTIMAEDSSFLTVDSSGFNNLGVMKVGGGGTLTISSLAGCFTNGWSLEAGADGTVNIQCADFTNTGEVKAGVRGVVAFSSDVEDLRNSGVIRANGGSDIYISALSTTNDNLITARECGSLTFTDSAGCLVNNGVVEAGINGSLNIHCLNFENHGSLRAAAGGVVTIGDQVQGFWSDGCIDVREGGRIESSLEWGMWSEGELRGSGAISGTVESNGLVSPGDSVGVLTIEGDFLSHTMNRLLIEIGGAGAGCYDQLAVSGYADVWGDLEIVLLEGFTPDADDTFTIVTANGLCGGFMNGWERVEMEGGSFAIAYNSDSIVLSDYQAVPECGTAILLMLGSAILRRRRQPSLK